MKFIKYKYTCSNIIDREKQCKVVHYGTLTIMAQSKKYNNRCSMYLIEFRKSVWAGELNIFGTTCLGALYLCIMSLVVSASLCVISKPFQG